MNRTWLSAVKGAKDRYWNNTVTCADTNSIWDIHKRHTQTHTRPIPALGDAVDFEGKVKALQTQFFPVNKARSDASPVDKLTSLNDMSSDFLPVLPAEVSTALRAVNLNASPGRDQTNTRTVAIIHETCHNLLADLTTQCLLLGVHYREWKAMTMVVIPKTGKRDKHNPRSYRPISLNSILGKLVEKIAANHVARYAQHCGAPRTSQFGIIGQGSAVNAVTFTIASLSQSLGPPRTTYVYTNRPSLIAHDIEGAFDHTQPTVLVNIMSKRHMPDYLITWLEDFTN
jgi:hypothetical protein